MTSVEAIDPFSRPRGSAFVKTFPSCKRNAKYNEEKLRKLSNLPTTVVTPRDVLHMNKNATHRHVIFAVGFSGFTMKRCFRFYLYPYLL